MVPSQAYGARFLSAFDRAWTFLMAMEGGSTFTNDPDDPGGATKYGISQRAYPREDIANLTEARAKELFKLDYWAPLRADLLPEQLAIAIADAGYNQGVRTAIILLQESLRVEPDGQLGPNTLAAIKRKPAGEVVNEFLSRRLVRYADGKAKYRRGWMLRVLRLKDALSAV